LFVAVAKDICLGKTSLFKYMSFLTRTVMLQATEIVKQKTNQVIFDLFALYMESRNI
jgi:hypothetical protein